MPSRRKTQPAKTSRSKVSPPAIPGEKRIKKTTAAVPVGPPRRRRGMHDGPTIVAAIDQRRQFSGTDEPAPGKKAKPGSRGGGNPGRGPVGLPGRV